MRYSGIMGERMRMDGRGTEERYISISDWCLKCCKKATEAQKLLGLDFQSLFLKHATYFQGLNIKRLSE